MIDKAQAPYPYLGINGEYPSKEFLDDCWRHLHKMAVIWAAGIDKPSPTDRLAYLLLKQITFRQPDTGDEV